ncbi:beta-glucosidase [Solirubrobacter pauli]|uniref:Beta-glucosidase n=1 Tax=Solirubrobacter pauli TaxID=166793 RepID=A0A660LGE0_9ACTN|nr:glycoside hydrolase family 3 C-terminal domain-containing protein [Solirubrobacter pauli]RKQ92990.1 beta-glucosidase [Solirubrobacter pauli]
MITRRARARVGLSGVAVAVLLTVPVGVAGAQGQPWLDPSLSPEERVDALLPQMTLEEKVALMTGDPPPGTGAYFNAAIPRLGIPELRTVDIGPGVRFVQSPTTAFPMDIALAATWNSRLAERLAAAVADEARATRHNMVLGPNVDIARNPFWSRIGETFGEDPLLSGVMAARFVRAAQADGDMAVNLKHYNAYTQETNRRRGVNTQSSDVDERTLQEIYTRPWAPSVREQLASVMCAYNRINGEHACEHGYLQEQVLRRQLGFDGFILTDFGASYHTVDSIEDGMDLETGTIAAYGPALLAAVRAGTVSEALVNQRVRNILRIYFRNGIFDHPLPATNQPVATQEHGGMAREIEQEAITLLKNRNAALPLQRPRQPQSIAVIGEGATWAAQQCCAAAIQNPTYTISPLQGIRQRAGSGVSVGFERGSDPPNPADLAPGPDAIPSSVLSPPGAAGQTGVRAEYWTNTTFAGTPFITRVDPRPAFDRGAIAGFAIHPEAVLAPTTAQSVRYSGTITPPQSGTYQLSLSGFGTGRLIFDGRQIVSFTNQIAPRAYVSAPQQLVGGRAYTFRVEYATTTPRDSLDPGSVRLGWVAPAGALSPDIQAAVSLASRSDVAVVVAGLYEAESRDRGELDLPTEQDELIDAVSRANPRTVVVLQSGGPVTMPWINQVDGIMQLYYGGGEQGRALADVLFGDVNPSGKLPISYPRYDFQPQALGIQNPLLTSEVFDVPFTEGVFVGYRGYERDRTALQFPFGYGLSYTSFGYTDATASNQDGQVSVSFTLRNTGERSGAEIAQVYAGTLPTSVATPPKQLAGWTKVQLAPGESRTVTVPLACKSLAYWDPGANTDAGNSEGQAHATNPNGTDPPSTNTDGNWVTPNGRVTLYVASSVSDVRLTTTASLRGGTCSEGSDLAILGEDGGDDNGTGVGTTGAGVQNTATAVAPQGTAGAPGSTGPQSQTGAVGPAGVQGPPGPAGRATCRPTGATRVLCTLLFADGSWSTAPASTRTATLRLLHRGRTVATGHAVLQAGKVNVRLKRTRAVRPGSYRLQITVAGKNRTVAATVARASRVRL